MTKPPSNPFSSEAVCALALVEAVKYVTHTQNGADLLTATVAPTEVFAKVVAGVKEKFPESLERSQAIAALTRVHALHGADPECRFVIETGVRGFRNDIAQHEGMKHNGPNKKGLQP